MSTSRINSRGKPEGKGAFLPTDRPGFPASLLLRYDALGLIPSGSRPSTAKPISGTFSLVAFQAPVIVGPR